MKQRGFISINMSAIIWFFVILGISFGAFLMWIIPIMWGWLMPTIHRLTA